MPGHAIRASARRRKRPPLIAIASFVCSIGNIPLAAVLWAGGISFAGVIAFIFADLLTLPIIVAYAKFYGRFTRQLVVLLLATMIIAALLVDLAFTAGGWIPEGRPSIESITDRGISLNYTAVLNFVFSVVGAVLLWLTVRRGATDPVCGMRVDRDQTPHRLRHAGRNYFFCSAGCRQRFESETGSASPRSRRSPGGAPPTRRSASTR